MITTREILDFINSQPDDRRVNMSHNSYNDSCRCVMVHYGKDILGLSEFECGWSNIDSGKCTYYLEERIDKIINFHGIRPVNYGEVKQRIICTN